MNQALLLELRLEEPHPILSEENMSDEVEMEEGDMYLNFGKTKLVQLLQDADAKMAQQSAEINKLIEEKTQQKIEFMK